MLSSSLDFVPLINSSLQSITTTESLCSREQASQGRDGQPPPCRRSPVKLLKFWQDKLAIWVDTGAARSLLPQWSSSPASEPPLEGMGGKPIAS